MTRTRKIAIVCQPWDNVAPQSGSSIVIIAYQLARRLASNSYVTIYGRRGPRQKQSEIDGNTIEAAVLVFPSVWNEPSGLPTFEAQACGTPVVSTYSGGIPEYVSHGRTGILVARGEATELATAIREVLDNPALARAMGEAGRQRAVEHFSWDVVLRRLADLVETVPKQDGKR